MNPMYENQYQMAAFYKDAVTILNNEIEKTQNYGLILPVIMNQTFAIELLLKCLILFDHKDVCSEEDLKTKKIKLHGHKLLKIYYLITAEKRQLIIKQWEVISKKYDVTYSIEDAFAILGDEPFAEWRYIFEKSINKNLERKYLDCLLETIGISAQIIIKKNKD